MTYMSPTAFVAQARLSESTLGCEFDSIEFEVLLDYAEQITTTDTLSPDDEPTVWPGDILEMAGYEIEIVMIARPSEIDNDLLGGPGQPTRTEDVIVVGQMEHGRRAFSYHGLMKQLATGEIRYRAANRPKEQQVVTA